VVLLRQRRSEQGHDAIAHHLVDRAVVVMDRLHHALQDRVEKLAGLLRVAIRQQLHRALEIGEQHRDLLAFALHQDSLRQVLGCVTRRR